MRNISLLVVALIFFVTACTNSKQKGNSNGYFIANDTCKKIDAYLTGLEKSKIFSGGLLIIKDEKKYSVKDMAGPIKKIRSRLLQPHLHPWEVLQKHLLQLQ